MTARNFFVGRAVVLVALLIVAGLVGGFMALNNYIYQEKQEPNIPPETTGQTDHKNIRYTINDQSVLLVNGNAETEVAEDSASRTATRYFGNEVRADFNDDGFEDVAFLLTQETDGSGVFYYVVAALGGPYGYTGTDAVFLGDRIAPQTTEFREGEIIVNFAERKQGEPMTADPSVGVSKYLSISDNSLVEVIK